MEDALSTHSLSSLEVEKTHVKNVAASGGAVDLAAGFLAGMLSAMLFYPLELVEARMQVGFADTQHSKGLKVNDIKHLGLISLAKLVYERDGLAGFVKGFVPSVLGQAINWGVYFSVFELCRSHPPSLGGDLYAGVLAGVVCNVLLTPFWVLKIRLIANPRYNNDMVYATSLILKEESASALWQGLSVGMFGVTEGAIQFLVYEQMKADMVARGATSAAGFFLLGAFSKTLAVLLTYPYQSVGNRFRAESFSSVSDCMKKIMQAEGIAGFYKGMSACLARSVPPSGFMFLLVELFRSVLVHLVL
eukprot:GILK01009835.1.p1 GENE.GILK01009835.1~~GILK01009835.1.p1  ORF type:complete len:315 (-),score=26.99 GILK01009835.1:219-1130(-)